MLGQEARAKLILQRTKEVENTLQASLKSHTSRPKVAIIHRYDNPKSISLGEIFGHYLLEISGGQNVVSTQGIANVSLQELYKLNPDIIYLNNFNTLLPEELYQSSLYKPLKAVSQRSVYKFPLGSYRPFAPSIDLPVLLLWLYDKQYPKDSVDVMSYARKYYQEVLGVSLSDSQLEAIFTPNKQAGMLE